MEKIAPTMRSYTDEEARQTRLLVRTIIPAKVLSYSSATQQAKIELSTQAVLTFQDGTKVTQPALVLERVPVMHPGSGSNFVHSTLSEGDTGLALVCDRSIADWRLDGEAHAPPLPNLHNVADCIFLPGVMADTSPRTVAPSGTTVEGSTISLGAGAVNNVAIAQLVHAYLSAMFTAAAVTANDGGAVFKADLIKYLEDNPATLMGSSKVKAE